MKLRFCLSLSLSLWVSTAVRAAGPDFTLDAAVAFALTNNADLAAMRLRVPEAASRVGNAGRWSNPELETAFKPNIRGGERSLSLGLSQRIPLTARLRLEKAVARSEIAVIEAEIREAERQLALSMRMAAIRFMAQRAHQALTERQLENSRELATIVARAARVGEGSELEVAQLELESAQLKSKRAQIGAEIAELEGTLRLLMGWTSDEAPTLVDPRHGMEPAVASSNASSSRADEAVVRARLSSANQEIDLARTARWQDATVGLFGEVERGEDAPNGLETDGFVGIRFSVPLPIWNDHRGLVTEAAAKATRIEGEADALAIRIRAEIAAAAAQREATSALSRSIEENLLPKARALEDRLTHLRSEGQAPFTDVLRARERRLQLEASAIDARRDFQLAHARWLAATGQTLSSKP